MHRFRPMACLLRCGLLLWLVLITAFPAQAAILEVKLGTDGGMLAFEPSSLTIARGDTVRFVNNRLAPHNAVFDGHEELSHTALVFAEGESWEETFAEPGTFTYWCEPHRGAGMVGRVIVQ